MRKLIIFAVLAASLATAACNTVSGAGKDVSAAGKAVTNTAEDVKHSASSTPVSENPVAQAAGFFVLALGGGAGRRGAVEEPGAARCGGHLKRLFVSA